MQIAERLSKINPSLTLAMNNRAQEMRAAGIPVISLAAGEPDFPTPEFVKDAAREALDQNFTRYTPVAGIPELRRAAGNYFKRYYDVNVPKENMIIGAGGKQCLYTFIQTTINPGDEVLIPSPFWVSYPDMVRLAEGVPVAVPAGPATGFKVTAEMLEQKAGPKTKMLILNSPCNPTGAVYSEAELAEIISWALQKNIFVLADEIYDQLVFKPAKMASAIKWFATNPENVAVVNGLSKSFAMTGWRVGFLAASQKLIEKMVLLQGHSLSNVNSIAQKAALAALTGSDDCVREMREAFERRRNLAMRLVSAWKRAICPRPDGAFYLFVDMHNYFGARVKNSMELCAYLLEKAKAAAVPGLAFDDDNCMRISYAISDAALEEALTNIGKALLKL